MRRNSLIVIGALWLPLALGACSSLPSWLGGEKAPDKPKTEGKREEVLPVLEQLQPDDELKDVALQLPPATENSDWPQHSAGLSAAQTNLAIKGFSEDDSATIGDGEEFSHLLIPRPVVAAGKVFAMDAAGYISAHDAARIDKVLWESKGLAEEDEPELFGGGLAYYDGKLYAVSGRGTVAAFDAGNGKQLWQKTIIVPFRSAPWVAGDKMFAVTIDNQIFAFSTANGDILWSQRGIGETAGLITSSSPLAEGNRLIVPYSSGDIYALTAEDGQEIWHESLATSAQSRSASVFSGVGGDPVIDGRVVIAVSSGGTLTVFNLETGQRVWSRPLSSLNNPWVTGDYLYVLTADNVLVCFVKFNGKIRWSTQLVSFENQKEKKNPIRWSGPVMVGGKLALVGSHGILQLLSATDGTLLEKHKIEEGIVTPPVVAGGRMYLVGPEANLYSLY
ncbi:MAG: PQQ-binding-like beta-propeller repeat protein [Rickettsiales bacterium]|nr:PQQ-binding-like beta-propeller repeat protein [Rickettsiales bacterium]